MAISRTVLSDTFLKGPNWQWTSIDIYNYAAPNRRQAIIWIDVVPIHWRIYLSLILKVKDLIRSFGHTVIFVCSFPAVFVCGHLGCGRFWVWKHEYAKCTHLPHCFIHDIFSREIQCHCIQVIGSVHFSSQTRKEIIRLTVCVVLIRPHHDTDLDDQNTRKPTWVHSTRIRSA